MGPLFAFPRSLILFPPWECPRKNLCAILRTPLQQLAQFRRTDVIAMSSQMKVPARAFLDEGRVAAIQVPSVRGIRLGQLRGGKKSKRESRSTSEGGWGGGEKRKDGPCPGVARRR